MIPIPIKVTMEIKNANKPHQSSEESVVSPKDPLVFIRNHKSFRMEKNKKHLRIIGDGNRVTITWNTGHVDIVGNSASVWIARNSGSVHVTGDHGRVFLGEKSEARVVDYVGCDGRVTVLEDGDMMEHSARTNNRNNRKHCGLDSGGGKKSGRREVVGKEKEKYTELIVKKDYLFPIRLCVDGLVPAAAAAKKKSLRMAEGFIQVTSEITIKTNIGGDSKIVNRSML